MSVCVCVCVCVCVRVCGCPEYTVKVYYCKRVFYYRTIQIIVFLFNFNNLLIKRNDVVVASTPSVVDRLGPEGKAHFDQACKKGKVPGNTVFIDCMGEEDAGKSCLEASMTDKPFVEGQDI